MKINASPKSIALQSMTLKKDRVHNLKSKNPNILPDVSEPSIITPYDFGFDVDNEYTETNYDKNNIDYSIIEDDNYRAQGVTSVNGKLYITGYDKNKNDKSRLYVFDEKTGEYEGKIILNNSAHVGGTTFDKTNEILYVTGSSGKINAYDYDMISKAIENVQRDNAQTFTLDLNTNESYQLDCSATISDYGGSAATIYYYNDYLYIATFHGAKKSTIKRYKVNVNKNGNKKELIFDENSTDVYITGKYNCQIQGIAVTEYNGKEYLITAESLGPLNDSNLSLYEFNNGDLEYKGKYYIDHQGIEGIQIDQDGNITAIFEFGNQETEICKMSDLVDNASMSNQYITDFIRYNLIGFFYDNVMGTKIFNDFKSIWVEPFNYSKDTIVDSYNFAKDTIVDSYNFAKDTIVDSYDLIGGTVTGTYNFIKDRAVDTYNFFTGNGVDMYSLIGGTIVDSYNFIGDTVTNAYNFTKDTIVDTYNFTRDTIVDTYNFAKDTIVDTGNFIYNMYDNTAAFISDAWNFFF